jgi:hypothetical protein
MGMNHAFKKKVQETDVKPDFTQFLPIIMTEAVKVFGYFTGFPHDAVTASMDVSRASILIQYHVWS